MDGEKIIIFITSIIVTLSLIGTTYFINRFSNNGIIFGVRVPKKYINSNEIKELERDYKKKYLIYMIPLMIIINILNLFIENLGVFVLNIFLLVIVTNIPVVIYWKKTLKLKEKMKWETLGKNVVIVDSSIRKPKTKEDNVVLSNKMFLLVLIIPLLTLLITIIEYKTVPNPFPIHYNAEGIPDSFIYKEGFRGIFYLFIMPVLVQVGMIALIAFMNKYAINGKVDINSGSLETIKMQRKVFKKFNSKLMYVLVIEINILMALIQLTTIYSWNINLINTPALIIIFATVIVYGIKSYKLGQGGKNININEESKETFINKEFQKGEIYRDDDKYWILGAFYYNKNDPSIFVEKRIGVGWTVNIATKVGMILTILPLIIIIIAIISIFKFTP